MNQAKIWLVVKPGVGIPLLLGTCAFVVLLVHLAILTHTTWISSYWQGGAKAHTAAAAPAPAPAQ